MNTLLTIDFAVRIFPGMLGCETERESRVNMIFRLEIDRVQG